MDFRRLRWGDQQTIQVAAGPVDVVTRQLISVRSPTPCAWVLSAYMTGGAVPDIYFVDVEAQIGTGSAMVSVVPVTNGASPDLQLPFAPIVAQSIDARLRVRSAGIALPRTLALTLLAAPFIPWRLDED